MHLGSQQNCQKTLTLAKEVDRTECKKILLNVEVKKRKLTSIKGGGQKVRKLLTNVWSKTILVGGRPVNSVHERFIIPLRCFLWRGQYLFLATHPLYDLFHALQGKLCPPNLQIRNFFSPLKVSRDFLSFRSSSRMWVGQTQQNGAGNCTNQTGSK